jgi:hypothetical protein
VAGGAPAGGGGVAPASRPDWLPEAHWDATVGIKPEFGAHYTELKTQAEQRAALAARKPEDIKLELKLPETVKVPDGFEAKVDENDPRVPLIRDMALKNGWTQEQVNELVAMDAAQKIAEYNREIARVAEQDKLLGANGPARKEAISSWLKGLLDRKELTAGEFEALRLTGVDADGIAALEKIIAKASGAVPAAGGQQPPPSKPADVPMESRWYGTQQRA